jgi:hypothetical protein
VKNLPYVAKGPITWIRKQHKDPISVWQTYKQYPAKNSLLTGHYLPKQRGVRATEKGAHSMTQFVESEPNFIL